MKARRGSDALPQWCEEQIGDIQFDNKSSTADVDELTATIANWSAEKASKEGETERWQAKIMKIDDVDDAGMERLVASAVIVHPVLNHAGLCAQLRRYGLCFRVHPSERGEPLGVHCRWQCCQHRASQAVGHHSAEDIYRRDQNLFR